jgi:hypothetical protein
MYIKAQASIQELKDQLAANNHYYSHTPIDNVAISSWDAPLQHALPHAASLTPSSMSSTPLHHHHRTIATRIIYARAISTMTSAVRTALQRWKWMALRHARMLLTTSLHPLYLSHIVTHYDINR